jgi:hypothetical protein
MMIISIEDDIDGFVVGILARLQGLVIRIPLTNLQSSSKRRYLVRLELPLLHEAYSWIVRCRSQSYNLSS